MQNEPRQIGLSIRYVPRPAPGGTVLLLGDDGSLARIWSKNHPGLRIDSCGTIQGVARACREVCEWIVINAEPLGRQAGQLIAALRGVRPQSRIVCYGPAWCEGTVRIGPGAADDFWPRPVGARQLAELFQPRGTNPPAFRIRNRRGLPGPVAPASPAPVLAFFREISMAIPGGPEAVAASGRQRLAGLLQADWVEVVPTGSETELALVGGEIRRPHRRYPLDFCGETQGTLLVDAECPETDGSLLAALAGMTATALALARREHALRELATRDDLTGARNRRYLDHFVQQIIQSNGAESTRATLLIFDIDDFKQYNDQYGHSAGDEILCEITRMIQRCCREHDIVVRFGGDEFVVLFWDTGQVRQPLVQEPPAVRPQSDGHDEIVSFMCNRFRRMIATSQFDFLGPHARGRLTISGGMARYPQDGGSLAELLKQADRALLDAKRQGKNRIFIAGGE